MTKGRLTPLLVGQCPADWQQVFIDEVTELLTNGYVGPSLPYQTDDPEIGIRYLQGFNVRPNKVDFTNATWITKEFHERNKKSCLREGDLLVVQSGHIGTAAVVPESAAGSNCHALIINRFQRDKVDPYFACHYINSEIGQARLRGLQVGSSMLHINTSELGRFKLPLPPIFEQRRLAEILGAWDAAIEKTGQLIASKESSLRGWMQRLVMDRQFTEHRLSKFVHRVNRKNTAGNGHPLTISGRDGLVSQSHYFDKRIAAETTEHYTLLNRGEFAYNKSYSSGYPYGAIKRLDAYDDGIVSTLYLCFALNPDAPLLSDYLIQFCEVGGFNHQIHKVAQEGARNHGLLNVAAEDFFAMKLPVPPIAEQSRVIAILGDAGRELSLFRKSLDQLRQQKRGLMQKLFTGQWRVPVESHEVAA